MSYTAIYTPLHNLETPASEFTKRPGAVTPGAKILDPEGLREFLPDWDTEMHTHTTTLKNEYPGQTWEYLEGFKTWDFDEFNIERLAIPSDDAAEFWSGVSRFTEPFQFFCAYYDGGYPHALDIATASREKPVAYHVTCWDGEIWVHGVGATRVERDLCYTGDNPGESDE